MDYVNEVDVTRSNYGTEIKVLSKFLHVVVSVVYERFQGWIQSRLRYFDAIFLQSNLVNQMRSFC